jgi:amino acid transporter
VVKEIPKTFVRDATGLVKTFGTTDLLIIACFTTFALIFATLQFPFFYGFSPGASLWGAVLIAGVPFLLLQIVYWILTVMLPRSGSDYVWVGRVISPSGGFAWSMTWMITLFSVAFVGVIVAYSSGIATSLTTWGALYNSPGLIASANWLSAPVGSYVLGAIIIVSMGILGLVGSKHIKGVLYIGTIAAIIGTAAIWIILGSTTPNTLAPKWDSAFGQNYVTYNGVIALAQKNGWTEQPVTIAATIAAMPLAALFLLGGNIGNVVSGEIKNVKRAAPVGFIVSLGLAILFWGLFDVFVLHATGPTWTYASGYLYDNNPSAYSAAIPYAPTLPMIIALASFPNQALTFGVLALYIIGSLPSVFLFFWIPSRYLFAWSFDRILPARIADVGTRLRTPHYAIGVMTGLGLVLLSLYYFTSWPSAIALGTFLLICCMVIPGLALFALPFRRKDLVDLAPGSMKSRVGGFPVISLIGLAEAIGFTYMAYLGATNPLITSPTTFAIVYAVGVIVAAFVIYFVSVAYHNRRGIDIPLAFKAIPPE